MHNNYVLHDGASSVSFEDAVITLALLACYIEYVLLHITESDLDLTGGLNAEVYIGLHRDHGRLDKSVKSFVDCMKRCLNMGNGLAPEVGEVEFFPQVRF